MIVSYGEKRVWGYARGLCNGIMVVETGAAEHGHTLTVGATGSDGGNVSGAGGIWLGGPKSG